jgi:autotransporter-associated beta strand protein
VVTVGAAATLNLNDNNITVPEISGAGAIIMSSLDAINNYSVNGGSGGGTGNITTGSNNVNATLSGGISGLGSIIKVGTGSLTLSGNNSYFGNTTVSAGTLVVGNVTALQDSDLIVASNGGAVTFSGTLAGVALGALTGNGTLVVSNGTGGNFTLTVGGSNASFEFDGILSGVNGFLNKVGPGTFTIANSETYAGNTTVSGGILQLGNGQTNGAVAGPIVNAGGTVQFQNATSQTYGGVISGGGGVTLNGSPTATVTLGGFSTYTGPTNLNSGTLVVNGGLAATGSIFVSGSNNATLGGNAVVGSVNVQGGGVIAPGVANAPGTKTTAGVFSTLTVNNLTLQSNASTFYPFHLSTFATGSKNSASDTIVVDGILTDTSIGTQYLFNFQDTGYFSGGSPTVYTLISINNSGGADTFTSAGFSSADFAYENLGLNPAGGQLVGSFQFSTNGKALDFVVVPEPSTCALLLGAAALLAAARRRRR